MSADLIIIIAALALGCMVFAAVIVWLLRPRRVRPEPHENLDPAVTRIVGNYIVTDNERGIDCPQPAALRFSPLRAAAHRLATQRYATQRNDCSGTQHNA
mgnify:CR=1 FL=1